MPFNKHTKTRNHENTKQPIGFFFVVSRFRGFVSVWNL